MKHPPGQCPCRADIRLYYRDGKPIYLCSACNTSKDKSPEMLRLLEEARKGGTQ
jgi:hypothetical protein